MIEVGAVGEARRARAMVQMARIVGGQGFQAGVIVGMWAGHGS
jgi:hypothetical protein